MAKVKVTCEQCGAEFETSASRLAAGRGRFCSKACMYASHITRVTRTCETCGKAFELCPSAVESRSGRFCSQKCYGEAKRNQVSRICECCGASFEIWPSLVERGWGKYCSRACQAQGRQKRVTLECVVCSKPFVLAESTAAGRRCCSRACRDVYCRETYVGENHPLYKRVKRTCEVCGADFTTSSSMIDRGFGRFCSMMCAGKWASTYRIGELAANWRGGGTDCICQMCGQQFKVKTGHVISKGEGKFCSRQCMGRWASLHRAGENSQNWKGGEQERQCEHCGTSFMVKAYRLERGQGRFCSIRCAFDHRPAWPIPTSGIELRVRAELDRQGMAYQTGTQISSYWPDLLFPAAHLIVEIDGDFWHNLPGKQEADRERDAVLQARGWRVLRIWEHEVNADLAGCVDRIEQAIKLVELLPLAISGIISPKPVH